MSEPLSQMGRVIFNLLRRPRSRRRPHPRTAAAKLASSNKARGKVMSHNVKATEAHPGWLYVHPAGQPVYWRRFDEGEAPDEASARARFEPDTDTRARDEQVGWTVRAGSVVDLVPAAAAVRASA